MSGFLGGLSTLNCIYFALVVAGLIFAIGMLLLGQFGGDGDTDVDSDGDTDFGNIGDLRIFSPITMATFVTVFGATGLVATLGFAVDGRTSLLIAFFVAAGVSLLVAFVYGRLLLAMQGSTDIRQADMIGMLGQVITPIPANGLGEVLFEISGERGIRPARAVDNTAIARGTTIVVEEIVGGVLVVRPR